MMKFIKRISLLIALVTAASSQSMAQDGIEEFLEQSVDDGEKLIGAYISPFMKSVSSGLNQGWYNTAKPHKVAGVDLTFTVNAMTIPKSELLFKPADLKLTQIELSDATPGFPNVSTVFGPETEPTFNLKADKTQTFTGAGGIDLKGNLGANMVPVPMVQLGFGLPKGFDIKLRFFPKKDLGDDSQFNMWGIGVMHDVKQWIPGVKMAPFDLSAFVGYTKLKLTSSFADDAFRKNGSGLFEMGALTIQGVISKKISVLTVYGGMGYNIAKSNLSLLGSYDFNQDGNFNGNREKNPFVMNFASSGPRVTAGFRLKLAVFTLHTDYTLQKYSCLSVGFGISVR